MTSAVYNYTVPTYIKGLESLTLFLQKAEKYANENNIPLADLVDARLYPDMKPLSFQIKTCSNTSKASIVRLTGVEGLSMDDSETTFEQLYARIDKTIEFIKSVDPKLFEGKDQEEVQMKLGPHELTFTGESYANQYGLPNFFFHLTTTYAILRSKGVPLGKLDYLKYFANL